MPTVDGKELEKFEIYVSNNSMDGNGMDYWHGYAFFKEPQSDVNKFTTFEDEHRTGPVFVNKKRITEKGVDYITFICNGELKSKL